MTGDVSSSVCSAQRFPSCTPQGCCALGFCKRRVCAPWQGSCPVPCPCGQGRAPLGNLPGSGWRDGVSPGPVVGQGWNCVSFVPPGNRRPKPAATPKGWEHLPALIRGAGAARTAVPRDGTAAGRPGLAVSHFPRPFLHPVSIYSSLNASSRLFTPRHGPVLRVHVSPSPGEAAVPACREQGWGSRWWFCVL